MGTIARRVIPALFACLVLIPPIPHAQAQEPGGVLKLYHRDSPASVSILEEATISTIIPIMGVQQSRRV